MVFPRRNRPQLEKPGPALEPGPLAPCPFSKRCRRVGGKGGPGSKGVGSRLAAGVGVLARGVLRPVRGQEVWEYYEPGPPNEPGPLAFSHLLEISRFRRCQKSGKKKAHKHKLFCPVGLGTTPGLSQGFRRVCPWDKTGFLLILHSGSPISLGLSLGQTQFVPGTIPGTKGGTESLCEKWVRPTQSGGPFLFFLFFSPKNPFFCFENPALSWSSRKMFMCLFRSLKRFWQHGQDPEIPKMQVSEEFG